jgi:hypothetical protein
VTPVVNRLFERRRSGSLGLTAWDSVATFVTTIDGTGEETGPLRVEWELLCSRTSWNGASGDAQLAKLLRWCAEHNRAFRVEFVRHYRRMKTVAGAMANSVPMELMRIYARAAFRERNLDALREFAPKNSIDDSGTALCAALEREKIDAECKWLWPLVREIVPNGPEFCKKFIAALDERFVVEEFDNIITAAGNEIATGNTIGEVMGRKLRVLLDARPELIRVLKERWQWDDTKERFLTLSLRDTWRRAARTAAVMRVGDADRPKL